MFIMLESCYWYHKKARTAHGIIIFFWISIFYAVIEVQRFCEHWNNIRCFCSHFTEFMRNFKLIWLKFVNFVNTSAIDFALRPRGWLLTLFLSDSLSLKMVDFFSKFSLFHQKWHKMFLRLTFFTKRLEIDLKLLTDVWINSKFG